MELLIFILGVTPVGLVAGYILARLTRPGFSLWVTIVLILLAAVLVWASHGQQHWDAIGTVIVSFTVIVPLAVGFALGALLEWARRRWGQQEQP